MAGDPQQQGVWFDEDKKPPVPSSIYNQYVQYPTAHMPSQRTAGQGDGPTGPSTTQPALSNKNPVMHLNELKHGTCLVFDITKNEIEEEEMKVDSEGETTSVSQKKKGKVNRQVTFTANVTVDGELFTGTSKNIKLAKQEAAKYVLLKKFNILYVPGYDNVPEDAGNPFPNQKRKSTDNQGPTPKKQKPQVPKNALMALNEYKTGLSYNVISQSGPVHAPTFVIAVEIDGQTFQGQGMSKKTARTEAAQNACRALNIPFIVGNNT